MIRLIKSQLPWFFSRIKFSSHNRIVTSKSLSETLILASIEKDCSLNYKFSTRKLQAQYMLCTKMVLKGQILG